MFLILDMFLTYISGNTTTPCNAIGVNEATDSLLCTAPSGFIPNFKLLQTSLYKDILKQNPLATALVKLNQYVITCDAWLQTGWTLRQRHSAKHVRDCIRPCLTLV